MIRWADFLISKVLYVNGHRLVERVLAHEDKVIKIGAPFEEDRETLISKIKGGLTYCTTIKKDDGEWVMGNRLRLTSVKGREFIRYDQDIQEEDDLGSLPEMTI